MSIKTIESAHNATLKEIDILLTDARLRRKSKRTVLEGVHLCDLYLAKFGAPIICLVAQEDAEHEEIIPIINRLEIDGKVTVYRVAKSLFKSVSSVVNGLGVLFVVPQPMQKNTTPEPHENWLVLDAIQDPGNLGTIIRTAAAAGINAIALNSECAACWSPKVMRAGMGGHFFIRLYEDLDLKSWFDALPSTRPKIIATKINAPQSLYDMDLSTPHIWLMGNEGQGLRTELLDCTEIQVSIPHRTEIESLNVASATAVCLFEMKRQQNLAQKRLQ